jgi:hypothetical membrane protein
MYSYSMTITPAPLRVSHSTRFLALGAVVGPVLFTLAWLVLAAVSPGYTLFDHRFTDYSPISQPISGLGMGATAPYMNAAFIAGGLILIAGVIGVFLTLPPDRSALRWWSAALLACSGIGQIMCGIFNLEAMMPHTFGFGLATATPLTLILLIAFFAAFEPTADGAEHGIAGLVQRLLILQIHGWFVAMGLLAYLRNRANEHATMSA